MPFQEINGVPFYQFNSLVEHNISHAIFTRHGGVSPQPWSSLNVVATVGDELSRVIENRKRVFSAINVSPDRVYEVWQVHSAEVVITDHPKNPSAVHKKADVILTDKHQVNLLMRFADCVPIFLYDPLNNAIGLAHAGWRGTVNKAAHAAVTVMQTAYGSTPEKIIACIGPSICQEHYPVGEEVVSAVMDTFGSQANDLMQYTGEEVRFDLRRANQLILEQTGIIQIEVAQICTACEVQDWYSHRAENGSTGRFGAMIGL
jgi:YfiH family protein